MRSQSISSMPSLASTRARPRCCVTNSNTTGSAVGAITGSDGWRGRSPTFEVISNPPSTSRTSRWPFGSVPRSPGRSRTDEQHDHGRRRCDSAGSVRGVVGRIRADDHQPVVRVAGQQIRGAGVCGGDRWLSTARAVRHAVRPRARSGGGVATFRRPSSARPGVAAVPRRWHRGGRRRRCLVSAGLARRSSPASRVVRPWRSRCARRASRRDRRDAKCHTARTRDRRSIRLRAGR